MPSLTTLYRAIVMIAVGVIGVKGWQLYGPSNEQVKSGALRIIELAQSSLSQPSRAGAEANRSSSDPRISTPPLLTPGASGGPDVPRVPPIAAPQMRATEPPQLLSDDTSPAPAAEADAMPALLSRLEELGAIDPKLASWGTSGNLYRFTCRAAWGDTPAYTRHFEAVAGEPRVAVEQVVTKVEAWQARRNEVALY